MRERFLVSTSYSIFIKDSLGNDLLDPDNGTISAEDINIYYLQNGEKKRVYNSRYDYPENFRILQTEDGTEQYYLVVFANDEANTDSISTTYIEFRKEEIDTLEAKITEKPGLFIATTAWYNGVLKVDKSIPSKYPMSFEIIK